VEQTGPSQTDEVIGLQQLCKSFGKVPVLREITLSIGPGVTGLLGPNGAGKSTLIKILLGLLRATSGSGHVLGRRLGVESRAIREAVGFMPEDDCYLPALSGVECVQFSARMCRLPGLEALRRAHEILDFCGAGQERYRTAETYSTGMRQKLKFAQALVHDPPLLILDEPTAGLDPEERDAMLSRIRVLAGREGKSVVLCTHILQDVQAVSDSVIILAAGRVCVADRLESLARRESPAVHLRTVGAPAALQAALEQRGLSVEIAHDGQLSIAGAGEDNLRQVWDAIRDSQTLIRSLTPAQNSMEAIFLKAVQGDSHGDS
jgi:ABC-2 type transport system ATP-binding protein